MDNFNATFVKFATTRFGFNPDEETMSDLHAAFYEDDAKFAVETVLWEQGRTDYEAIAQAIFAEHGWFYTLTAAA